MSEKHTAPPAAAPAEPSEVKLGMLSLWMIGVGSFIGGNFIGWPSVLIGGFGSALISVGYFGVYFLLLGNATGELSARFRDSGGTYMYSKRILGDKVGAVAAVCHIVKLIAGNCCMVMAISGYVTEITVDSDYVHIASWIACYFIFTTINCYGGYSSIYFQNGIVAICLIVVLLYFYASSKSINFEANALGDRGWFEGGFNGFILGFPYGIWFMDGFEELPLAIELAGDAVQAVPMALTLSAATALSLATGLLFFGASSTNATDLMNDTAPLMISFVKEWGHNRLLVVGLDIMILLGLAISFSAFVLFTGRMIQTVAADGLLPAPLAEVSPRFGTPIKATVLSSIAGLVITTAFGLLFGADPAEDALIACSLLASISCYIFNFCCLHVVLKAEEDLLSLSESIKTSNFQSPTAFQCPYGGSDPGDMRFGLGRRGVEFSIGMSLIVLLCILYIFWVQESYHLGILILTSVVIISVLLVYLYACISTERRIHEELSDLSTRPDDFVNQIDVSMRSTVPMVNLKA